MRIDDWLSCGAGLLGALRTQWRDEAWWRRYQNCALATQLAFAGVRVPFYRKLFAQYRIDPIRIRSTDDLSRLPILSREQIQRNPLGFLDRSAPQEHWRSSRTSGSMGRPLVTWFDPWCWRQVKYTLKMRRLLAWGWRPGQRIVIVDDVESKRVREHTAHLFLPGEQWLRWRDYVSVFEHPQEHLEQYVRFQPHYLYGFPSYFLELAGVWHEWVRRRIPLRGLMTSSERMEARTRSYLELIFGVRVLDVYGLTEFKEIAWQCPVGPGYHINMDSVVIEVINEHGRPVAPGERGEVIVTSLTNRAMPLIRYATGDLAVRLGGHCSCGRGLERLDRIEGRIADYVPIPQLGRLSPYELTTAIETCQDVLQFKVVQPSPDLLDVRTVLRPGASTQTLTTLQKTLHARIQGKIKIIVSRVNSIPRTSSGKHQPVEVQLKQDVTR